MVHYDLKYKLHDCIIATSINGQNVNAKCIILLFVDSCNKQFKSETVILFFFFFREFYRIFSSFYFLVHIYSLYVFECSKIIVQRNYTLIIIEFNDRRF